VLAVNPLRSAGQPGLLSHLTELGNQVVYGGHGHLGSGLLIADC